MESGRIEADVGQVIAIESRRLQIFFNEEKVADVMEGVSALGVLCSGSVFTPMPRYENHSNCREAAQPEKWDTVVEPGCKPEKAKDERHGALTLNEVGENLVRSAE